MAVVVGLLFTFAVLAGCGALGASSGASAGVGASTSAGAAPSVGPAAAAPRTAFNIAGLRGPTSMGLVKLAADSDAGSARHDYALTVYGTADEVLPDLVAGTVDMAAISANAAAIWYNKTDGLVQVAAVNTLGVLYVVEAGDSVQSVDDLVGKTIYSTGQGTTPEYVLNYILAQNGIDPATDVTIEYRSEATEVAGLLQDTPGAIAVLPQPYVTVLMAQNPAVRVALDLTREWDAVAGDSRLLTAVLIARRDFISANPAAFAEFLQDYRASIDFANTNPAQAAVLIEQYGIFDRAAVVEQALPACNLQYIDGAAMKTQLAGYLQVLYDQNPNAVGGAMPDDDFYYIVN